MSSSGFSAKICIGCSSEYLPSQKDQKYCSRECYYQNGYNHRRKKSTWWINKKGYVEGRVWIDSETQIRIKRHRWVMEKHLGRKLKDNEDVHHKNGNKLDNSIGNLEVLDHGEHSTRTNNNRDYKTGYEMDLSDEERKRRSRVLKKWHEEQK